MDCINQHVVHKKFGQGVIKDHKENIITIYFQEYGAHTFIYPQAFDKYLTARDPEFAKSVSLDLDKAWEEQANRELEQRKRVQEMVQQAKREKMAQKKEKKPAARLERHAVQKDPSARF